MSSAMGQSGIGNAAGYGTLNVTAGPPVPDTITARAQRVCAMAAQLRVRAASIDARLWPTPPTDSAKLATASPDALPWILEQAERDLDQAIAIMDHIANGI